METARGNLCPLTMQECMVERCARWCTFGEDCAVPLLTGIMADSTVCQTIWSEEDE